MIALHGGPAAYGSAAPLAKGLADNFRVIEPWQRPSGPTPLTVAQHIRDLKAIIDAHTDSASKPGAASGSPTGTRTTIHPSRPERPTAQPALIGESWGAMLALACAAAHPDIVGPIVLVGCGTFDKEARACLQAALVERTSDELRRQFDRLADQYPDLAERMRKWVKLTERVYAYDPIDSQPDPVAEAQPFDLRAHEETWSDMIRLQEDGTYPAAFAAIKSPVLMIHGDYDPHPGPMIRDSLLRYIPQLEYHELTRCGHDPAKEKHASEAFFELLTAWLTNVS